jgi:hypothetical protein
MAREKPMKTAELAFTLYARLEAKTIENHANWRELWKF